MRINLFYICLIFFANPVFAMDYVWLIGGGPDPDNSQVSIEKNVIWIKDVLDRSPGDRNIRIYFNGGAGVTPDIVKGIDPAGDRLALHPLARVFGQHRANGQVYRHNKLSRVDGTTRKKTLLSALKKDFSLVTDKDRVLIIFNGHGLKGKKPEKENTVICVWGNKKISVREFEEVLGGIPAGVPVRFVFPQCFSGGFAGLVNPDAQNVLTLNGSVRCGFFAESARRESEG